jgi:hypothetical protein
MYPFISTTPPIVPATESIVTVTRTLPAYSKFIWLHTLLAAPFGPLGPGNIQIIDSAKGPITSIPVSIFNFSGRVGRPYPLPEPYVFEQGSVITATIVIIQTDPPLEFAGIIMCGFREQVK